MAIIIPLACEMQWRSNLQSPPKWEGGLSLHWHHFHFSRRLPGSCPFFLPEVMNPLFSLARPTPFTASPLSPPLSPVFPSTDRQSDVSNYGARREGSPRTERIGLRQVASSPVVNHFICVNSFHTFWLAVFCGLFLPHLVYL